MAKGAIRVSGGVRGASKLKAVLDTTGGAITALLARDRIQSLLLKRTTDRFKPKGGNRAQTDPNGIPWAPVKRSTVERRRYNKNKHQGLVDSQSLVKAIAIVRSRMSGSALQSPTGGGFSIGIKPGSPANKYARTHQLGGYTGTNHDIRVKARRFLGIGAGDVAAVQGLIKRVMAKSGIQVT